MPNLRWSAVSSESLDGFDDIAAARDVVALIADEPVRHDDKPDLGGWMQRLCRAATRDLVASGVGVNVMSSSGAISVLAASSPQSEVVEQLQFTLGEGPCMDAYASGRPVLTPDLATGGLQRWPGYAAAAQDHGVRSVFSFPLQIGAARLGAMDVCRQRTGPLSTPHLSRALAFAEAATVALVTAQDHVSSDDRSVLGRAMEGSFLVYQAQGMVQVQLGASLVEAMSRLRAYAFSHDRPLYEVAADVVERSVVFEPDR